jgi:hypothetical protein
MATNMYLLNSASNTVGIDAQVTAFGCTGIVNGVATVCQYISNMQPNQYCAFDSASGLHVQTDPDQDPSAVYDWQSGYFQIIINTQLSTIQLASWSGPSADADVADAPKLVKAQRPAPAEAAGATA